MAQNDHGAPVKEWADLPDYITADEAAEISGYHVNYIRRLMRAHKITGRKAGLVWLIERDSLQAYTERIQALGAQKFTPDRFKEPD